MSDEQVKAKIKELFVQMNLEIDEMMKNTYLSEKLKEDITDYVARKLAVASRGYLSSLYTFLSDQTLREPEFQNLDNSNKFFDLELDRKMAEAYKFDANDLPGFSGGIDYEEINRVYVSAAAGIGTFALSGILLGVLSKTIVHIPVHWIIAGAVIAGLAGLGVSYTVAVPDVNRDRLSGSVHSFMGSLEQEMYIWVDGVIAFYNSQVEELKKTL